MYVNEETFRANIRDNFRENEQMLTYPKNCYWKAKKLHQ